MITSCFADPGNRQGVLQQTRTVGAGDQHTGGAVAQNMPDLFRFEDRVDRHEHAAGRHRAEHRVTVSNCFGR